MLHNPYIAIAGAALAAWIFGALWYGLLGRVWMAAQGISPEEIEVRRQARTMPLLPMAVSFASEVVMAVILIMLLTGLGVSGLLGAMVTALMLGVGFVATSVLVNNMFQGRKLMLSLIDSAHWIIVLVIESAVLVVLS